MLKLHLNPITFHPEKEVSLEKQSHLNVTYWNALLGTRNRSLAEVQIFIRQLNECGIEVTLTGHLSFIALTGELDKKVLSILSEQKESMSIDEIKKSLPKDVAGWSNYNNVDIQAVLNRLHTFYYVTKEEDGQKNILSAKITPVGRSYRQSLMQEKESIGEQIEIPIAASI